MQQILISIGKVISVCHFSRLSDYGSFVIQKVLFGFYVRSMPNLLQKGYGLQDILRNYVLCQIATSKKNNQKPGLRSKTHGKSHVFGRGSPL